MAKLTYQQRKHMPKSDFALPGERDKGKGGYPIENKAHARDALSRVSADGTPAQKKEVRAKVHKKYPGIGKRSHGGVPRGEHHHEGHREPRSHEEFERLGQGK